LKRNAGNISFVKILKCIHCRRVNPPGPRWRHHNEHRALETTLSFQFLQSQNCALLDALRAVQSDINPDGIHRRALPELSYRRTARTCCDVATTLPPQPFPRNKRRGATRHRRVLGLQGVVLHQGVSTLERGVRGIKRNPQDNALCQRPKHARCNDHTDHVGHSPWDIAVEPPREMICRHAKEAPKEE